ncbi:unnamed protein product [Lactuca virosa]|uniref:Uncharacterized protein n=1 Tax=Lactuca virosa TaxID=75947 RepID=A0AAU9NZ89_9ASTR|nr:unnamed protein product [Lactuca virosa]
MEISNGYLNKSHHNASFAASSQRDVTYRCGSCGYDLNLSSSARNTATIGSKYDGSDSASGSEVSSYRKYDVRIRAVQPSSSMEAGLSLVM